MSAKDDTSWMPRSGSYQVDVGSSLSGALKANKGLPQAPKLSDRGFYSFRCAFSPLPGFPSRPPVRCDAGRVAGLIRSYCWLVGGC